MPTINWLSRHYEASNYYQVGEYDTNHESLATTNFDPFQTNFHDSNLRITSNMLSPDIEPSFPRQCPANFPLEHWPFHALQRSFPMSSSTLNLDINDQLSSDAIPFDAFRTTMCDLRASLDANLPSSDLNNHSQARSFWIDCGPGIPTCLTVKQSTLDLALEEAPGHYRRTLLMNNGYINFEGESKEVAPLHSMITIQRTLMTSLLDWTTGRDLWRHADQSYIE